MSRSSTSKLAKPVDEERDHTVGPSDAPVTLVEYGDYECPYCGRAYPIVQELQNRFGDKLRFVFRNFPLRNMHPHAEHAAEAAEAAAAQGEFWAMHDTLYENQGSLEDDDLNGYANQIGLDVDQFEHELQNHVHETRIQEDIVSGARSGVNGTPTFFIDGTRFDGNWTEVESFAEALNDG